MRNHISIVGVFEYIIAMLAILDCNTVYSKIIGSSFTSFSPYIIISLAVVLLMKMRNVRVIAVYFHRLLFFFAIYGTVMGLFYVFNARISPAPMGFIAYYLIIIPFLIILFVLDKQCIYSILQKYTDLMYVIAIVSLLCWLLFSQVKIFPPTTYFFVNWGRPYRYPVFLYIYVERQVEVFFGLRIIRNIAFFAEAPMYSACLVMAIALEQFIGGRNKFKVAVLYFTIITTFSATGLLLGIIIIAMDYLLLKADARNQFMVKLFGGIILFMIGGILFVAIFSQKATSTISWSGRILSIVEGYKVMKEYPVFGCGYRSFKAYLKYMPKYRVRANLGMGGSASGIGSLLGQCGLIMTLFYANAFGAYCFIEYRCRDMKRVAFAVIILILLFFAVIQYTFMMLIIIAFFYQTLICREERYCRLTEVAY